MTPFRIGGFYRAQDGMLYELRDPRLHYPDHPAGEAWAWLHRKDSFAISAGFRYLADGRDIFSDGSRNLIPGEVNEQGEPIAPTFYCAAETIKVEGGFERYRKAAAQTFGKTAEPKRPRLTWADSKPFDAFDGFKVKRDTATPDHAYSHYLTRVADAGAQTPPVCGSAWLVVR